MRFPSRIGAMSLRSMIAMDSSCFSVAFRAATVCASDPPRGWGMAGIASARNRYNTFNLVTSPMYRSLLHQKFPLTAGEEIEKLFRRGTQSMRISDALVPELDQEMSTTRRGLDRSAEYSFGTSTH